MTDLRDLRLRFAGERPQYEQLALHVSQTLHSETRKAGIQCSITPRAKTLDSFLKKALRYDWLQYDDAYERIDDKAGVRVVLPFADFVSKVEQIVHATFNVRSYENKVEGLDYYELGYLGSHFKVNLFDSQTDGGMAALSGLICEIQIHTQAQNAWANASHDLAYKPLLPTSPTLKRDVFRLMALVEIFDSQIGLAKRTMESQKEYPAYNMLSLLERQYYRLSGRPFDPQLSLRNLSMLRPLYSEAEAGRLQPLIDEFVSRNEEKLIQLFDNYADDTDNLILCQPEALVVFERLGEHRMELRRQWEQFLPFYLLEQLAAAWGVRIN